MTTARAGRLRWDAQPPAVPPAEVLADRGSGLTPAGRKLLPELERVADELDAELLTALDASERAQLISLLQRVAESEGLAPGVHPNLERMMTGDDPAQDGGPVRPR